ncbi:MAG TPA: hypothetical protein VKV80_05380 [Streptosporangiaceae bacterium]|nr:hypothetical protein [Streptosporangiaceae bacterium]
MAVACLRPIRRGAGPPRTPAGLAAALPGLPYACGLAVTRGPLGRKAGNPLVVTGLAGTDDGMAGRA